jgi:phosphopentomutase
MRFKRTFLIVLDSLGIGELPDAESYGDCGSNTLKSVSGGRDFYIPNLLKMGLGNIDGVDYLLKYAEPLAAYGRFVELSKGKDTTTGHYEIAGLIMDKAFPTYPEGFPKDVVKLLEKEAGIKTICNKAYSGTEVIKDYGKEHIDTGAVILYTSADSVMQLAAHEERFGLDRLYRCSEIARRIMVGEHAVGRIIARPFLGEPGSFYRTPNRHDFALEPPGITLLDLMKAAGLDVIGVGKINDIFAGKGITENYPVKGNALCMDKTLELAKKVFKGLCFVNLVDFDMLYGHRNDREGYASALTAYDKWMNDFLPLMKEDDCLIITADHGCDPLTISTDHSREYVPGLFYGKGIKPINLGTRLTFADIGATIAGFYDIKGLNGEDMKL